jgi:hypothetical protein
MDQINIYSLSLLFINDLWTIVVYKYIYIYIIGWLISFLSQLEQYRLLSFYMNRWEFKFNYLTCRFCFLDKMLVEIERKKTISKSLKPLLLFFFFIRFSLYVCLGYMMKDHIKDTFRQSDNRHYTKTKTDDVIFSLDFFWWIKVVEVLKYDYVKSIAKETVREYLEAFFINVICYYNQIESIFLLLFLFVRLMMIQNHYKIFQLKQMKLIYHRYV